MKGKYVVFEGPDGSGKTSLANMLYAALLAAGEHARPLAFPSRESAAGRLIRDTFTGVASVNPESMMWLFVADGKDVEPQIRNHVKEGDWIVCDRHTMVSGLVYQAEVHGANYVDSVTKPANFTVPDRIYLVDVPAKVAMDRRLARGTTSTSTALYEPQHMDRLESMCQMYRGLVERFPSAIVLDGTKPLADNLRWIWTDLGLPGEPPAP